VLTDLVWVVMVVILCNTALCGAGVCLICCFLVQMPVIAVHLVSWTGCDSGRTAQLQTARTYAGGASAQATTSVVFWTNASSHHQSTT